MSGKNKKNRKQKNRMQRRSAGPERMISSQMYAYRRTCSFDVNINPATGFAGAGNNLNLVFSLQQVSFFINGTGAGLVTFPSSSEFTSLFDQYQFRSVEVDVYWSKNVAAESGTNATQPMIWSCFDYDDVSNTTLTSMQQYPAVKSTILGENGGKVLQMRLIPRTRVEVPDGSGGTAYAPTLSKNPWIDCGYPSVEHYGVKTYLDTFGRTSSLDIGTIKFVIRAEWMFAHPR
jgi:hypothetical protein